MEVATHSQLTKHELHFSIIPTTEMTSQTDLCDNGLLTDLCDNGLLTDLCDNGLLTDLCDNGLLTDLCDNGY